VKNNKIADYSFDVEGNFSFGISDYTDFKEMRYDPNIGIFGMDISVTLARRGLRVKNRKRASGKIPRNHKIKPDEAKKFVRTKLAVEVVG
jgi:large subunit ribosomal protein L5